MNMESEGRGGCWNAMLNTATFGWRGRCNGRGKPTASSLSADGFSLLAGPNFQPSDGNPTVMSIFRQLDDGLENVPEM